MSAVGNQPRWFAGERQWLVVLAVVSSLASGCKSGSSWAAKPAWWSFGQTPPAAADKLGAAPAFSGDATKPSATAKAYPTTSTPQGYALDNAAPAAAAPVTYGVTPPPQAAPANIAQWSPSASGGPPPAAAAGASAIAPQVGRYATDTASAASPPAAPAVSTERPSAWAATPPPPASQPTAPPPAAPRMADARAAGPDWTGSADAVPPPATPTSRYSAASSRFSGSADATPAAGAWPAPPAADPVPAPAAPPFAAPAAAPSTMPASLPAEVPAPGGLPPLAPPSQPMRRPDPGYRPGGTSSYRPARSSIAGEPGGGVQPASFESRTAIAP
jgi:hypothetical protein